ncbi:hypothetical protein J5N97_014832 [Dioscorea zingiberensis]|uniref:V-SNARE coiled-coil homology domain-containing protein n=1 Tax=Dioscorea zingiberensis TaxID=325984 RepID=A0A9D5CVX0_9LILI|nr:hypothetical protein J5N97_014832 [Dioscorea zingiberensis]
MFAKRLFHKSTSQSGSKILLDLDLQIAAHYGVPYTASIMAFDPIQRLLAIGTLDGRIKIIGGDNIEGLLISPKKLPFKSLEFLQNQGFLVGVSNENDIQVWDLECRRLCECFQWESNITAFSAIQGTCLMYIGDDSGLISVLKYNAEEGKLLKLPYQIPPHDLTEAAGISFSSHQAIVGILPQPYTFGTRVLIAYENGVIVLWDVSECQVVTVRGYTELQLKDKGNVGSPAEVAGDQQDNVSEHGADEREICSLCWASDTGSILAVGYINGDILLWNISANPSTKEQQAGISTNDVVKLQLASGDRRLPVIVLHWSNNSKPNNDRGGQLFIYGGDEMGSDEVLTILSLEWSSGIENLRCISRMDLNLDGSFADMILIPKLGSLGKASTAAVFILTNPGQLNVYDGDLLANLKSEGKPSQQVEKFPVVVPTIDPLLTVTKFWWLSTGSSNAFVEKASTKGAGATPSLSAGTKWPLTGGVPNELVFPKENGVVRLFVAGYQDGSVRIWDATNPVVTLMFIFEAKVANIELEGQNSAVSALEFCSKSMTLAVGNEFGLVRIYKLQDGTDRSSFHFVSEAKHEVHNTQHGNGVHCFAAFFILNSPIRALHFVNSGDRFAVGYENGQVAMLDISSMSIVFHTGCLSGTNSPVISIATHLTLQSSVILNSPKQSSPKSAKDHSEEVLYILTKDARVIMVDSITGSMINLHPLHPKKESAAISMYVLDENDAPSEVAGEKTSADVSTDNSAENESKQSNNSSGSKLQEPEHHFSCDTSYVLLCCDNALRLYSLKSVLQGDSNFIRKVNLEKNCCWTTLFKKRDEKACVLVLLYQTGGIEIRSLPDLEVLSESSLMSILRWSFKANMDKTICSYDYGQIALVNGGEVAFLSLLACENDFRIPDSLPCLHDKVVAAAADAAIGFSSYQKKKQDTAPGILGGLIKGLKGVKAEKFNVSGNSVRPSSTQQLEEIFSRVPFSDSATPSGSNPEANELSIDDIEIDDTLPATSTSSQINKSKTKDEEMEREKLFEGGQTDIKPRVRTTQEILTKYRFNGDAAAAAAHAKDKLVQRQEKLERLSKRTEELQSGAENFAEMANELVKTMENKKWWKL